MKYVVYYRVSTKKQGRSGLGLESQGMYINHFLKPEDIAETFTEVKSAKNIRQRPELKNAIQLCKENGYTLAVAKLDRLSRDTEDALSIFRELEGRLFSCDVPNMDEFTLTIFSAIATRERKLISIRNKAAAAAKRARGERLGRPENLTTAVRAKAIDTRQQASRQNKNNKRAVDIICRLRHEGKTYRQIADYLNEKEYYTANQGKRNSKTGSTIVTKGFHATTVRRLFMRNCGSANQS